VSSKDASQYNRNEKADACRVFEDVWNALGDDEGEEEEEEGVENGGSGSLSDDEQRWFDLQDEWKRVKDFCDLNRDIIKPPFREKRPLHETTAKPVPGLAGGVDSILDITNISQSVKAIDQKSLKRDWFGIVRAACKEDATCTAFQPSFPGCPAPQCLFERAIAEGRNDLMERALQWSSLPPGKFCAKCGCSCEAHETEEELAKRLRIDAILKRKQEDVARSKASRLREAEAECRRRVSEAVQRRRESEASGEYIRETSLDFITQVKRGPCPKADHCPGFKVIFRESDALNPEVMLFCSLCGHPSSEHPVDTQWMEEQRRRKERERQKEQRFPLRQPPRGRPQASTFRRPYDEAKRAACRLLGVPLDASAKQISRAYVTYSISTLVITISLSFPGKAKY